MAPAEQLFEFMVTECNVDAGLQTMHRAGLFLKAMDAAMIKKFLSKYQIFHATISESMVLYSPAGYVVVEQSGPVDNVGFCLRGLTRADGRALQFFQKLSSIGPAAALIKNFFKKVIAFLEAGAAPGADEKKEETQRQAVQEAQRKAAAETEAATAQATQ